MSGFGSGSGICLRVRVGFDFIGFGLFPLGPRVSGFRVPDFITSPDEDELKKSRKSERQNGGNGGKLKEI